MSRFFTAQSRSSHPASEDAGDERRDDSCLTIRLTGDTAVDDPELRRHEMGQCWSKRAARLPVERRPALSPQA